MSHRFTEQAQRIVLIAQEEAQRVRSECVEPLHILLALIASGEGLACQVLVKCGASHSSLREKAMMKVSPGTRALPVGEIPFTPEAKEVLKFTVEEAQNMGLSYVGTEHVLLGLFHVEMSAGILKELGLNLTIIREEIRQAIGVGSGSPHQSTNTALLGQQLMVLALSPIVSGVLITNKRRPELAGSAVVLVLLKQGTDLDIAAKALSPNLPIIENLCFKLPGQRPMARANGEWREEADWEERFTF